MSKFGQERFPPNYQDAVGMQAREALHKNSEELVEIVASKIEEPLLKVFELGAGGGRNLHYLLKKFPQASYYCSDFFRDASFKNMSAELKHVINFTSGDSEDVIKHPISNISLFIFSDHLMHLQYEKADVIIKETISNWKPNYVLLRELKKEFETPDHPRLFHDYNQFLEKYNLVYETSSEQDSAYFIWLLKRK